ncbi:hypothetical protein AMELA_G00284970 [Ameiurus melas]|uniref:Uncharacterized protein n=1 Tax=Ameiurus melas TaxID=219545 RepID=A0A7J5ZIB4_AMEME|nr:hypothetical protein AMELA_G00284970 [Ameiurus melas]
MLCEYEVKECLLSPYESVQTPFRGSERHISSPGFAFGKNPREEQSYQREFNTLGQNVFVNQQIRPTQA